MKKFIHFFKNNPHLETLALFMTLALVINIGFFLFVNIMVNRQRDYTEILEPGTQFIAFKEKLHGVKSIGYLTDKNLSSEQNDGFFLQAQYHLAPIIVELNNPQHEFNIIDFKSIPNLVKTVRQVRGVRIAKNEFGQALIRRLP